MNDEYAVFSGMNEIDDPRVRPRSGCGHQGRGQKRTSSGSGGRRGNGSAISDTYHRDSWLKDVQKRLALFCEHPDDIENAEDNGTRRILAFGDEFNDVLEKGESCEVRGNEINHVLENIQGRVHGVCAQEEAIECPQTRQVSTYVGDSIMSAAMTKAGVPTQLYEWQAECLNMPGILENQRNLVYCAPTSGGKSMVAEVLMMRQMMLTGKPAMLVLPFVSICTEKASRYKKMFEMLPRGKRKTVVEFYGSLHTSTDIPHHAGIIVSTIEKANILVNQWLEEGVIGDRISSVCVDELHMVGDADRGYLLEIMLTKLKYVSTRGPRAFQIIGMSATISNVHVIAEWLDAVLYRTNHRPVPLHEYFVRGDTVTTSDGSFVRALHTDSVGSTVHENDSVCALVQESLASGHSVIVFCCSRNSCERMAQYMVNKLKGSPELKISQEHPGSSVSDLHTADFLQQGDLSSRKLISEAIEVHQNSPGIQSLGRNDTTNENKSMLQASIEKGIGWHHAGLDSEEREIVEAAFKSGSISVLCATSTLAAGVNLPARRVIFRHSYIGKVSNLLNPSKYRQMAGRAGRAGLDTLGESFLLHNKGVSESRLYELMNKDVEPISSCLDDTKNGLYRAMLEAIASGCVTTPMDVNQYVTSTLLSSMIPYEELVSHAKSALSWLGSPERRYISWEPSKGVFTPTSTGIAVHCSGLSPETCTDIVSDLSRAREALVLSSDLHLTYICVPLNEEIMVDWGRLSEIMNDLPPLSISVSEKVGVQRAFIIAKARGYSSIQISDNTRKHGRSPQDTQERICKRFWIALILSDILQETPFSLVHAKFGIQRGLVQGIQDRASRHAGMLATFCARVGWTDFEILIRQFQSRVLHGVLPEMLQLMEVPRVKAYSARLLFKAGLKTPEMLAAADPVTVEGILSHAYRKATPRKKRNVMLHAKRLIAEARKLLIDRAEALREKAQTVMDTVGRNEPVQLLF